MFESDAWGAIIEDAHRYPSPHNSQPIKVQLRSETQAGIYYDLNPGLPAESYGIPVGHVCAGVFRESLRVRAQARGYEIREELHHGEMGLESPDRLHFTAGVTLVPRPAGAPDIADCGLSRPGKAPAAPSGLRRGGKLQECRGQGTDGFTEANQGWH